MNTQDLLTRISCLEERLAELLKENTRLHEENARLHEENARLHEENERLRHRVGELEEILKSQADSKTSKKPKFPLNYGVGRNTSKKQERKKKTGKTRGRKPG